MTEKLRLDILSFGLALGTLTAIVLFSFGLVALISGLGRPYVDLVSSILLGYSSTIFGSIMGAVWGFILGFVEGLLLAWFYNVFQKMRQ